MSVRRANLSIVPSTNVPSVDPIDVSVLLLLLKPSSVIFASVRPSIIPRIPAVGFSGLPPNVTSPPSMMWTRVAWMVPFAMAPLMWQTPLLTMRPLSATTTLLLTMNPLAMMFAVRTSTRFGIDTAPDTNRFPSTLTSPVTVPPPFVGR